MNSRLPLASAVPLVLLLALPAPAAAADPPDTVLARRGDVVITRADWDAELLRIPAKDRAAFASNLRRNYTLLERMLNTRELALKAREQKLDADPLTRARIRQEEEKVLAAALLASAEEAAARDFDLRQPLFERRARELYEVDKRKYATPETAMVTVLFFAAGKDGFDVAERRAKDALAKIKGGSDIGELASALSDDATTREVRGRKGPIARADVDAILASAIFALKRKGDVTEEIRTSEGYWVIRLDERRAPVPQSFDQVKGQIMAELKQQQLDAARAAAGAAAGGGKEIAFNPPAIEALRPPAKTTP